MSRKLLFSLLVLALFPLSTTLKGDVPSQQKPWCYWWWMGSSVNKPDLTANLENMARAGFGGVHIIPIYGEKGDEANYISYLSPQWMEMLVHVVRETERLGMGIDMTTGTGWPFGGPSIDSTYAAKKMDVILIDPKTTPLPALKESLQQPGVIGFTFYDRQRNPIYSGTDLHRVTSDLLNRSAEIAVLSSGFTGQKVKRSAPGGEGWVLDPFTSDGMKHYMSRFKEAFAATSFPKGKVRAFYNDSYEIYGANFTPRFLDQFKAWRGYDLLPYMIYLKDTTRCDLRQRVVTDYCETISDLLLNEYIRPWSEISHQMGMINRNQAHGSPGNLLDLYGAVDIPETESFGSSGLPIPGLRHDADYNAQNFGRPHPLTLKFSSSAAHTKGKSLTAAESCTWLADHFKTTLAQVKPQIDELFVSGINHVVYHGVPYSPPSKPFPGRLFYASVNFGPTTYFWDYMPELNRYIADCQGTLQNSTPDNDILLYFAVYDVWRDLNERTFIRLFDVHKPQGWLQAKPTGITAGKLWERGYTFDYISDRGLQSDLTPDGSGYRTATARYKTILIPDCRVIPLETLKQLLRYARQGGSVVFEGAIPTEVNGLHRFAEREAELKEVARQLTALPSVSVATGLEPALETAGVAREPMADSGLSFIRKRQNGKTLYFVANLSNQFREGEVELGRAFQGAELYHPQRNLTGKAQTNGKKVRLQLSPGESVFVRLTQSASSAPYPYISVQGSPTQVSGPWRLTPLKGEPSLPKPTTMNPLKSWTGVDNDYRYFSGTVRYSTQITLSPEQLKADGLLLSVGDLRELASVRVNGKPVGLLWAIPSQLALPASVLQPETTLEIDVTNCSFNRVIDLDKRGVVWKNFHEINFVDIRYRPFDASDKEPVPSGLLGPVTLQPFRLVK